MDAYNHLQMHTFQDLLDLTKAFDVLQWLSPDPTSSSTNGTEPISWQGDTLMLAPSSDFDSSSTSYSKTSMVCSKGSSSTSPTRVRWADEKKIVTVYPNGSSSPTREQWTEEKKIVPVRSSHEHETWKHIQLARTAADQVGKMKNGVPRPQILSYVCM
jgi:hypothetical protein